MREEIRDFLESIIDRNANDFSYQDIEQLQDQATILLYEDFKEEVLETFDYMIHSSYNKNEHRKIILKGDKITFISDLYGDDVKEFINNNFKKLDVIIEILQEEIKKEEQEKEDE